MTDPYQPPPPPPWECDRIVAEGQPPPWANLSAPGGPPANPPPPGGMPPGTPGDSHPNKNRIWLIVLAVVGGLLILSCGASAIGAAIRGSNTPAPGPIVASTAGAPSPPTLAPPSLSPTTSAAPPTPTEAVERTPPPQPTTEAPPPPPPTTEAAPEIQGVHPGAFCSEHWSYGRTSTGLLMQCKPSATDSRFRWRQA